MSPTAGLLERYGPWALVTGCSSGIGEQFARELAAAGLHLVLVARRADRLKALAEELRSSHAVEVEPLALDLTRPDFIDPILARFADRELGLIVSNAGEGAKGPFDEQPLDSKLALLDLNCRAPLVLIDALAPRLIERGRGGILITSSIESVTGFPWSTTYAATKAFASSLGEGLWGELRDRGVDVLVLEPGATDTELLSRSGMSAADMAGLMEPRKVARQALERMGRGPRHIAGPMNRMLVRFLSLLPRGVAVSLAGKGMKDAIELGRKRHAAAPEARADAQGDERP